MIRHLLIQMPLLAVCGVYWVHRYRPLHSWLLRADPNGVMALVLASGGFLFWMLPLNLDMATIDPGWRLSKVSSVPLGIGALLGWAWRQVGPIGRGVLMLEGWAAITRLGWIYLISPDSLCANYLLGDQRTVGRILLAASGCIAVIGIITLLFGSARNSNAPDLK